MSQNNVNFGIDPTGSQLLDELLTDEQQNNLTVHGGTARPEYAMVGTIWTDKSVEGVATLKRFNGTSDDVLLSVNSVEGVATVEKALLYNSKYKYSKNSVVINATDSEVKLYKSLVADNVGNALSDVESWEEISLGGGVDLNTGDKVYDWIGTLAEYKEQDIENQHPEYLCFITDDETPVICATRSLDNLDAVGQAKLDEGKKISVVTIPTTTGNVNLSDNTVYTGTITGEVRFLLPTVSDETQYHQIKAMLYLPVVTIDWGTTHYIGGEAPDISEAGQYMIYWDYVPALTNWAVGCMKVA